MGLCSGWLGARGAPKGLKGVNWLVAVAGIPKDESSKPVGGAGSAGGACVRMK